MHCCAVSSEVAERIRESVAAGRRKSMFEDVNPRMFGIQCRCGVRRKPPGLAKHVNDDGMCPVHPEKPAQPYVPGVQ